jgi:hypothetical protein
VPEAQWDERRVLRCRTSILIPRRISGVLKREVLDVRAKELAQIIWRLPGEGSTPVAKMIVMLATGVG